MSLVRSFCGTATSIAVWLQLISAAYSMDMAGMSGGVERPLVPAACGAMEVWDVASAMCMPLPMAGMPMRMFMMHGNAFAAEVAETGPRGRSAFAMPNMFMADVGTSMGASQYLNLDFMGTLERWTYPGAGYPLFLQIGEETARGAPFLDAQHPHSSPIMGLTLSDTIALGSGKDHLRLWFAPRGQSSDGPVAFMHRPTGMVNPDAPLGHHVGQDVGHISSTVIGGLIHVGNSTVEISLFHGAEPRPDNVDLPLGAPNSISARFTREISERLYAMVSAAYVRNPEPDDPDIRQLSRYSASFYYNQALPGGWDWHDSVIYGLIRGYDHCSSLNSFAEEFWFRKGRANIWGRLELLQRTAEELEIASPQPRGARWVLAATLGYTQKVARLNNFDVGLGASLSTYALPTSFRGAYGGDPWAGKIFLQLGGMKMWDF